MAITANQFSDYNKRMQSVATVPKRTSGIQEPGVAGNPGLPKVSNVPNPGLSSPATPTPSLQIPKSNANIPSPPKTAAATFSTPQYNDWMSKQNETFNKLEQLVNTPFTWDPATDAGYQAQLALSQKRAGVATQNALEAANDRGILGSSITTSQLGQIQQAAEQEALAYIPQYREQAFNQYQSQLANAGNLLNQAIAMRNNQFNEAVTEAGLTGDYLPAGAQQLVNQIYALKSQAEQKGLANTEVKALSAQANELRAQLQAMGVDVSKLGADTSLANSSVGQRTMAGQQLDYSKQADQRDYDRSVLESDRNYNRGVLESDRNFTYTQGRDAVADAQWEKEFQRILRQDGINEALNWAQVNVSRQNAATSAGQLALSRDRFAYDKEQDAVAAAKAATAGSTVTGMQSASNSTVIRSGIDQAQTMDEAIQYLNSQGNYLQESDYRKLLQHIYDNF